MESNPRRVRPRPSKTSAIASVFYALLYFAYYEQIKKQAILYAEFFGILFTDRNKEKEVPKKWLI